jgi:riboflavin synthase|tara:strand:- start:617 stop:1207 length:591 start_codon:yes stop_codon:yes gene_type:complete
MFTGLVETKGLIDSFQKNEDGMILRLNHNNSFEVSINDSVSCNGVCLTVVRTDKNSFEVQLVNETLDRTTAEFWKEKDELNLERALLPSTRMGGHFVQGHVDCVTKILKIKHFDKSSTWTFKMNDDIEKYIVEKGSIALNGVSLTVASKDKNSFDVALIPHTIELTTFGNLTIGDSVNVEVDILGKYIENFLGHIK